MVTEKAQGIRDALHSLVDALPDEDLPACLSLLRDYVERALSHQPPSQPDDAGR